MSVESLLIVSVIFIMFGVLLSDWTITHCSHCGSMLIRRFHVISPILRISPAITFSLCGWVSYSVIIIEDLSFLKSVLMVLLCVTVSSLIVMSRILYLPINFSQCPNCGKKPGFRIRQFF
jgi:predicted RNA-binding Zn-ribbon protein involved in translation (DUF1610 family)